MTKQGRALLSAALTTTFACMALLYCAPAMAAEPCKPHANATGLFSVNEGATVTLDGSTSRVTPVGNGPILSYQWEQDPTDAYQVTLNGATSTIMTFVAPQLPSGSVSLRFTLTVTGCSPTVTDSKKVTVAVSNVANQPPVAVAGVNSSPVAEGQPFTLVSTGSYDPEGASLSYCWMEGSNPGMPPNCLSQDATVSLIAPSVGTSGTTLQYTLAVYDGTLWSAGSTITVNVTWTNEPPVAKALCCDASGPTTVCKTGLDTPITVDEGKAVLLDGSTSTDDEDGIKSYFWSQETGGPSAGLAADQAANSLVTFAAPHLKNGPLTSTMTFKLAVDDNGGASTSDYCAVTVVDKTPPVVTVPSNMVVEATGPSGANVSFDASAKDDWDGDLPASDVSCSPMSGSPFTLDLTTTVTCSATDKGGNTGTNSFTVQVVDTTPPTLALPADQTIEATGPKGAVVTYSATATDIVDITVMPICTPASGSTFALGTTVVNCTATDKHANAASGSFNVAVVDTTPPTITVPSDKTSGPTEYDGAIVKYDGQSATDIVDGEVSVNCLPASGFLFPFGVNTVTCTATDAHDNSASKTFKITVTGFEFAGFFQPVDNPGLTNTVNTVKAGSTVPFKWTLQGEGGAAMTDTRTVKSMNVVNSTACSASATYDDIEVTATGGTSLRYDLNANQFVYNWQTPKAPGACLKVTVNFTDNTGKFAYFKLK